MKNISLITSGLLLSSTLVFAADSIDQAFKEGKVEGSLNIYTVNTDNKGGNANSAFTSGDIELAYETATYMGFSAKAGFVGAHVFDEKYDGDAADIASNAIMSEANIKYANEAFSLTLGRQAIDLEWLGDFNEAAVAQINAVPNTEITLGYSDKQAVAGVDEVSEKFEKVNGKDGIYVIDVKYTGLENVELNPYFYSAPDLANFYGLKASYSTDMINALAHYAASNEDVSATEDGSIAHIELGATIGEVTAAVGYIKTDKDGGTGSIAEFGDNISPFEDGNYVYDVDAKTIYGAIGYEISGISLSALYGETKYSSTKENELNLSAEYSFTDSLSAAALYADINNDDSTADYNKVLASVSYSF
jgi:hypothetical protein